VSLADEPRASLRVSLRGSVHLLWRGVRGGVSGGPLAGPSSGCLVDLGGGPAQRRSDLVGLDLDHRALLALLGFPCAGLQTAGDDDALAGLAGLGDVLGELSPGVDGEEVGLLDLLAVAVGVEAVDRDAEPDDGLAGRGVAELGVSRQVPNDGDGVVRRFIV